MTNNDNKLMLCTDPFDPLPKHKADSIEFQKQEARRLRALKGWGGTKINKLLKSRYPDQYILTKNSFQTAIKGIDHSEIDIASQPDYDPASPYRDSQFIYRINLICERLRHRKLKVDEARIADSLMMGLKELDLVTAFIIIEEYYERNLKSKTPQNDDLDLMVATTPWVSRDDELFYNQMRTSRNRGLPEFSKLENPKSDVDYYIAFHVASVLKHYVSIDGVPKLIVIHPIASKVLNKANEELKFGFPDPVTFVRNCAKAIHLYGGRINQDKEIKGTLLDGLLSYEPSYLKKYQTYKHVLRAVWVSELTENPPYNPFVEVGLDPTELRINQPLWRTLGVKKNEGDELAMANEENEMTDEQMHEVQQEDFSGDRYEEQENE